ncbi:MAG: 5-(carboxyamino)imidazole ribonucleotide mutase [Armatimonadetes bacterium]|nr:5-(carboxyamino)imidazole ribonucleotide mutase [Armatimonadota bacterium]
METTRVGIVMGSTSDAKVMQPAQEALAELGIACEVKVLSAHRTPDAAAEYAATARARGLKAIIAGAGGAAHLAGALASRTTLPVIGVPVSSSALNGVDALYATVQMPPGIPVATVAIDGARNAALLAAQIIGAADSAVAARLEEQRAEMAAKVLAANES